MGCCGPRSASQGVAPTDQQVEDAVALLLPGVMETEIPPLMEQLLEDYAPGSRISKQEIADAFNLGPSGYPGLSIPSMSIPVLGNGRDVDLLLNVPSVYSSVANDLPTFILYVDGAPLDLSGTLASVRTGVAGADGGVSKVIPLTVTPPAGVTKTYSWGVYSTGTLTFNAVPFAKIQYTATRA